MERQNKDELLNSLYAASSHAERCLSQLTDSLEESELLDLCAKFYTPLFENGRKVHAWIPDTVLPQLELELAGVDPELVTRLTESLNEFALMIIMIQLYSQLSEEIKNNDVFAQIISNFRALADQAVQEEALKFLQIRLTSLISSIIQITAVASQEIHGQIHVSHLAVRLIADCSFCFDIRSRHIFTNGQYRIITINLVVSGDGYLRRLHLCVEPHAA